MSLKDYPNEDKLTDIDDINYEILLNLDDESLSNVTNSKKRLAILCMTDNFWNKRILHIYNIDLSQYKEMYIMYSKLDQMLNKDANTNLLTTIQPTESPAVNKVISALAHIKTVNGLALISAALAGCISVVKCIIEAPGVEFSSEKDVALSFAAENGHLSIVRYLIEEANADMYADNDSALRQAAKNGHILIVKYLIEREDALDSAEDSTSEEDLVEELPQLKHMIDTILSTINSRDNEPLKLALENGHLQVAKYLIEEAKMDVHYGCVLASVTQCGHLSVVKYLVEEAKVDIHEDNDLALMWSAQEGYLDIVKYLIEETGENDHIWDSTALVSAARNGHLSIVKYLVEEVESVDVHAGNDIALADAASEGHLLIVKYLIEEAKADVHAGNDLAMEWAMESGQMDIVKYLVEETR